MVNEREAARTLARMYRVTANMAARSRTGGAILSGLRATARSFGGVLHQLWLEVTGFTFLAIAGVGVVAVMREYAKYQSGQSTGPGRLLLAIGFTVSFAWFGLSSFWRVRRRARAKG